ncbi:MAG: glycosyltransferase family 2 protein, partial [Ignavibacteriales bacterium]
MKYVIISPVKNEEKYISYTLESVVNQTRLPEEWIIVDDGSTDNTSG